MLHAHRAIPMISFPTAYYGVLAALSYQLIFLSHRTVTISVVLCLLLCAFAIAVLLCSSEEGGLYLKHASAYVVDGVHSSVQSLRLLYMLYQGSDSKHQDTCEQPTT